MKNNNLFGFDEILEDQTGRFNGMIIVEIIIRAIAAITTFGFAFKYAGNLFDWLTGPAYSPWLSAVIIVICIDVMAYVWQRFREFSGSTQAQLDAARYGLFGCMTLTVLVTAVFIIFETDFIPLYDETGGFNQVGQTVNIISLLVGVLCMAGNVSLVAYYFGNSAKSKTAANEARLAARRLTGAFAIKEREEQMIMARSMQDIFNRLPRATAGAAADNTNRYMRERFREMDDNKDGRLTLDEIAAWISRTGPEDVQRLLAMGGGDTQVSPIDNLPLFSGNMSLDKDSDIKETDAFIGYRRYPNSNWRKLWVKRHYVDVLRLIEANVLEEPIGTEYKILIGQNFVEGYYFDGRRLQARMEDELERPS